MEFSFSWFDIVIIIAVLAIGIKGLVNGFIKEFFGLLGIIGGIFLASRFAEKAGIFINDYIYDVKNEAATQIIGFASLLIVVWLIVILIGIITSKIFDMGGYSTLNKLLGFIFSSAKIFLVLSVLLFALSSVEFIKNKMTGALGNSFMYNILCNVGQQIVDIRPIELPELPKTQDIIGSAINATSEAIIDTINNLTTSNDTDVAR